MSWILFAGLLAKSSLVALAGLGLARLIGRTAVERVDILRAAVCLLLALPVVTAVAPSLSLTLLPAVEPVALAPLPIWQGQVDLPRGVAVSGALPWPSIGTVLAGVWLVGVVAAVARLLLGLRTLERWTRTGHSVTADAWLTPLNRLPAKQRPQLLRSDQVFGPLSWGVGPGVVLLDPKSLSEPAAAPSILAHELAHLRRRDWAFLMLSRLAVALFWFNPLVWRLHADLADRSEEAADAAAVGSVDRHDYARALVRLAAQPPAHSLPGGAVAMAADARTLKKRIACIMSPKPASRRPLMIGLTVAALAAVAAPVAAVELSRQVYEAPPAPPAPPTPPSLIAPPAPPAPPSIDDLPVPPAPPAPPAAPDDAYTYSYSVLGDAPPAPPAPPSPPAPPARPAPPPPPAGATYTYSHRVQGEAAAESRRHAAAARAQAGQARHHAAQARAQAEQVEQRMIQVRVEARAHADADVRVRARVDAAEAAAGHARLAADQARVQADRAMVQARVQMAAGAEQMRKGAREMRQEATRLRDPAYRTRQIQRNREQGRTVTDAQLVDLSVSLPHEADTLDREADHLAGQANAGG